MPSRQRRTATPRKKYSGGTLVIIGGREDKSSGEKRILAEVARLTGPGELVVASAATGLPGEVYQEYAEVFKALGVKSTSHLHIETGEEARRPESLEMIERASTVFFTGGDQLRITTKIGGSPLVGALTRLYERGGTIAGTSAGAAVMGETMLLGGNSMDTTESHKVGNWMMAPGLGFVKDIIIDQHFGQRARIGRLLGAVALNPRVLGIGIDEDTSIMVRGRKLQVMGSNAVYIIDGHDVTYTNIAESAAERTMSLHDVKVHILSDGEFFDLNDRRPRFREEVAERIEENGHTVAQMN